MLKQIVAFRRELHHFPELSGHEQQTAKKIKEWIQTANPDQIIENVGGYGLMVIFRGKSKGKSILLRADMDALPIHEANEFEHRSSSPGISHKCGHDGHSAILAGVARWLGSNPPEKGSVILLFQPAEETGKGASLVLADPGFAELEIDFAFAIHNLPGFPKNSIVIRDHYFAAASRGMIVRLTGITSHAAHPEHGISPALALADIIRKFGGISVENDGFQDFKLITIVHARLGERAFGTSPGYAEVMATLRTYSDQDMKTLVSKAIKAVVLIADKFGLDERVEWTEEFPATINDEKCVGLIRDVATENNLKIIRAEEPFRWSEDFGHFLSKYPGALFGVGAGKRHPVLHHPDYDFPDEIIPTGISVFTGLIQKISMI